MSMIGKTLAHYEITSQLGKGGMGEIYQAKSRKKAGRYSPDMLQSEQKRAIALD